MSSAIGIDWSCAVRYRCGSFFVLAWLLAFSGCDNDSYNSPEPESMEHHSHLVVMHFRTVNHAADTLGVVSVTAGSGYLLARRDAARQLSRSSMTPAHLPVPTQLVYPDSQVHTCSTYIDHYVGYQSRYGGDTTHFGEMDRYGTWVMEMIPNEVGATFAARESASVYSYEIVPVPDTVRPDGVLDLDIEVDVDGLLTWQPSASKYILHPDHIRVTQP
jgi:hypothetical protein